MMKRTIALVFLTALVAACGAGSGGGGDMESASSKIDGSALMDQLALMSTTPTLASPDDPLPAGTVDRSTTNIGSSGSKFHAFKELTALAANGPTPVIIGLNVPFAPNATGADAQAQASAVSNAKSTTQASASAAGRVSNVKQLGEFPQMAMTVDAAALTALYNNPTVSNVWPDEQKKLSLAQAGLQIGADAAWTAGFTGAGQTVAILDSGVDKTHPFLSGKVVSEGCYSTTGSSTTSTCPGGVASSTAAGSGVNCNLAYPGCDHGTHVAGIAAGKDPGTVGYSGIAKDANIIAIQVFSYSDASITAWTSDIIFGLSRVYALRTTYSIAAVNLSLGGGQYFSNCDTSEMKPSIDQLRAVGIATIVATGNDDWTDSTGSPACISTAISVGSICDNAASSACTAAGYGGIASYSDIASFVSLLAPGSLISSSVPGGTYAAWNGTSMATPMVTGAFAVAKQKAPAESVTNLLAAFTSTATLVNDTRTGGTVTGLKKINLDQAIATTPSGGNIEGDMNGDGKGDIFWRNIANGVNAIWFMNGATLTSYGYAPSLGTGWQAAGVGDMNGDGKGDIMWRNPSSGANYVWFMNGATKTSGAALTTASSSWSVGGLGDLNGDGKADIVWRHSTGANAVWYMNGSTIGSTASLPSAGNTAWEIVGVGDMNGDKRADILWHHTTGKNVVWFMTGAAMTSYANLLTVASSSWSVGGLSDLNGDGKADVLWRNTSGANVVWYMNGATRTSYGTILSVGNSSYVIGNH
jgi:subtilisin family serine protease/predicted small secreted protein